MFNNREAIEKIYYIPIKEIKGLSIDSKELGIYFSDKVLKIHCNEDSYAYSELKRIELSNDNVLKSGDIIINFTEYRVQNKTGPLQETFRFTTVNGYANLIWEGEGLSGGKVSAEYYIEENDSDKDSFNIIYETI